MNIFIGLFITFAQIGMFTFGGGYAMIPLIEHECVDKKHWITFEELVEVTVIAESTPGPVAINCATYTGYKKAGIMGAVSATVGMILPSFLAIMIISSYMDSLLQYEIIAKGFKGIRIAVGFLIMQAGINMVRKMLKRTSHKYISMGFVIVFFAVVMLLNILEIHLSVIYLVIVSGFLGFCIYHGLEKRTGK